MSLDLSSWNAAESNWSLAELATPDGPMFVRRNQSAAQLVGHPALPVRVGFAIPFKKPSVAGYPDPDENDSLAAIEDQIISAVSKETKGVHVLTLTNAVCKELVFYANADANIASLHQKLMENVSSHDVQCQAQKDAAWTLYSEFDTDQTASSSAGSSKAAFSNREEISSTSERTARFSNREEMEQIGEYRRFNVAALVAFLLGIASAGSLISWLMWIVPFVAVVLGALGLWQAARRENMGGRALCWIGIFLALFFVAMSASKSYFHRHVFYTEAEVIGQNWLKLVTAGEDMIAHQAMMPVTQRAATGFSVDEYYEKDVTAEIAKNKIFGRAPAKDIMVLGPDANIKLINNITQDIDLKYGKLILQTYRVSAPEKDPVDATLVIARSYREELDRVLWMVLDIKVPD